MGFALQTRGLSLPGNDLSDSDAGDGIDDRRPDREDGHQPVSWLTLSAPQDVLEQN